MMIRIRYLRNRFWNKNILVLLLNVALPAHAFSFPALPDLVAQLGIQQQEIARLEQNRIFFFNLAERHEKELSLGAVTYLSASPEKVIHFIRTKGVSSIEDEVSEHHFISPKNMQKLLQQNSSRISDREAFDFLSAKPGRQFNLSREELHALKSLNTTGEDISAMASAVFSIFMQQRLKNYQNNGLKGIPPYDRGANQMADPALELHFAASNHSLLKNTFPELFPVWLNYPSAPLAKNTESSFLLINRIVETRPTTVLLHRLLVSDNQHAVILLRQFYVEHSYNSNQITILCMPYRDGTLFFFLNQSFTDQITGLGSSLKRAIGREQKRRKMDNHLRKLNNTLQ